MVCVLTISAFAFSQEIYVEDVDGNDTVRFTVYSNPSISSNTVTSSASIAATAASPKYNKIGIVLEAYIRYSTTDSPHLTTSYQGASYAYIGTISGSGSGSTGNYTDNISIPSGGSLQEVGSCATYYYNCTSTSYPSSSLYCYNTLVKSVTDL